MSHSYRFDQSHARPFNIHIYGPDEMVIAVVPMLKAPSSKTRDEVNALGANRDAHDFAHRTVAALSLVPNESTAQLEKLAANGVTFGQAVAGVQVATEQTHSALAATYVMRRLLTDPDATATLEERVAQVVMAINAMAPETYPQVMALVEVTEKAMDIAITQGKNAQATEASVDQPANPAPDTP